MPHATVSNSELHDAAPVVVVAAVVVVPAVVVVLSADDVVVVVAVVVVMFKLPSFALHINIWLFHMHRGDGHALDEKNRLHPSSSSAP